jgi:tetratricopeptide (TPR) repeat protein
MGQVKGLAGIPGASARRIAEVHEVYSTHAEYRLVALTRIVSILLSMMLIGCCSILLAQDPSLELYREQQRAVQAAQVAEERGEFSVAEENYGKALRLASALPAGAYHVQTDILRKLANLYGTEAKLGDLERVFQERLKILETKQTGIDLDVGVALLDLESFYSRLNKDQKAEEFANRAIDFFTHCRGVEKFHTSCDGMLAEAEGMLAELYFNRRMYDRAEPLLKKVVARPDDSATPRTMAVCLSDYAGLLAARGQTAEANNLARRAELMKKKAGTAGQKAPN